MALNVERKGPVDLKSILPDEADPLRPLALRELVKVDMELRWRRRCNSFVLPSAYLSNLCDCLL